MDNYKDPELRTITKFLAGDVIKLYKNTNNDGRIINGFVQPNGGDIVGPVSIWYLGDI